MTVLEEVRTVEKYPEWPKIARLNRDVIITEKIDGTNALVEVVEHGGIDTPEGALYVPAHGGWFTVRAGSRTRWITPSDDNHGFARWVHDHADELALLGPGRHYGEWYGQGIQRNYGLDHKRFALFNVSRWGDHDVRPECCDVVPIVAECNGSNLNSYVQAALDDLSCNGSHVFPARGFAKPEGIVVYHTAARTMFKVTLEGDEAPKSQSA